MRTASVYSITIRRVMIAKINTRGSATCTKASFGLNNEELSFAPFPSFNQQGMPDPFFQFSLFLNFAGGLV